MRAAHAAAATRILSQRQSDIRSHAGAPPFLDLHGLHVAEALSVLEARIEDMYGGPSGANWSKLAPQRLHVCVGKGSHNTMPARLPAAVTAALSEWGLQHRVVTPGLLEVRLS